MSILSENGKERYSLNDENLLKGKATQFRSGENARENGAKGGRASAAAKRRKNRAKEAMEEVLSAKPRLNDKTLMQLKSLGLDGDDPDIQLLAIATICAKAMQGDVRAVRFLLRLTGEDPKSVISRERMKLRRERLKLERQRLEFAARCGSRNNGLEGETGNLVQSFSEALK